jgi:uncharacterized protein DUF4157
VSPRRRRAPSRAPGTVPAAAATTRAGRVGPHRPGDASAAARAVGSLGALAALARQLGNTALDRLLRGGARRATPLDARAAAAVGAAYHADLSGVTIADDAESHAAAAALGARAFAAGDTVYLGAQAPAPGTPARESLLAHELAHVVQQREAGTVRNGMVNEPGDQHEQSAAAASRHAARGASTTVASPGAPAAVQRDPAPGPIGITKHAGLSRADAQQILLQYFRRTLAAQGGRAVSMTDAVKADIRRIFVGDINGMLRIDSFLGRTIFPGSPDDLAAAIAPYLPDPVDPAQLAHLGASSGPGPSTLERVGDVVKKTEPFQSPEVQRQQWEFDRRAKELRKGEGAIGPFGVDLQRLFNIGKKLPGALKPPKAPATPTEAKTDPTLEAAIASLEPSALTPAAAKGTAQSGEYADAQLVARDLAQKIGEAQRRKRDKVTLQLGANYQGVKDREGIIQAVIQVVRIIRDALPDQGAGVSVVDVYFGDRLVQRIPLGGSQE